jgi:hypothetical protein
MKDRLWKTWSDHVRRGAPLWRIRRRFWKTRYRILEFMDWWPPPDDASNPYKEKPP